MTTLLRSLRGGRAAERFGWTALRYRPFQLFFVAMFAGNLGGFMYAGALGWYVLGVTGSPAAVGIAFAFNGLPLLLLTMHAGSLTDRFGPKRLLALGIGLTGVGMLLQAVVALSPGAPLELISAMAFVVGVGYALGSPGSLSIVSDLVPPESMSSSVALNFLQMNTARIVGGLAAGALLAWTQPWLAFTVAGIFNVLPALLVATLPIRSRSGPMVAASLLRPVIEAFAWTARYPTLRVLTVLAAIPGAIGMAYIFVLPTAATELGVGAQGLGTLLAIGGVGGLIAGLTLETIQRRFGHGRAVFAGMTLAGVALVAFAIVPGAVLATVALLVVGYGFAMYAAASLTLVQALAPPRLRGRLIGVFALLYWGLQSVASVIGGSAAEVLGGRGAVLLTGAIMIVCAVAAAVARPQILTLQVSGDGLSVTGDLAGTGFDAPRPQDSPLQGD